MTREEIEQKATDFNNKLKKHPCSESELIKALADFVEELQNNFKDEKVNELLEYNVWLMEVWNPNQLHIPFANHAPFAFVKYKQNI